MAELSWLEDNYEDESIRALSGFFGLELASLGYVENKIDYTYAEENIKSYQRQNGYEATGQLTYRQFTEVGELVDKKSKFDVYLPFAGSKDEAYIFIHDTYLAFEGTWVIDDEDHAFPYNYWQFECQKTQMSCRSVDVSLSLSSSSLNLSKISTTQYNVIEWNADEIVISDTRNSNSPCRKTTIYVYPNRKEVIEITRQVKTCDVLPNLEEPRVSRLVGGYDRSTELNSARREQTVDQYSPELKDFYKEITSKLK